MRLADVRQVDGAVTDRHVRAVVRQRGDSLEVGSTGVGRCDDDDPRPARTGRGQKQAHQVGDDQQERPAGLEHRP